MCNTHRSTHFDLRNPLVQTHNIRDPMKLAKQMSNIDKLPCAYAQKGGKEAFTCATTRKRNLNEYCGFGPDGIERRNGCKKKVLKNQLQNHLKNCYQAKENQKLYKCPNKCGVTFSNSKSIHCHLIGACTVELAKRKNPSKFQCHCGEGVFA